MPYKEKETVKLYYSIGEVAEILDVNASLLRFWEKEFDVLKPQKNSKGNRIYTQKDLKNLRLIHYLVKEVLHLKEQKRRSRKSSNNFTTKLSL
jgi:DNA-binding transcriptional MerR regulator